MSLQNPTDCLSMYRSPDSYIPGTPDYFRWLQCGVGSGSASGGYNSGNTGRTDFPPLVIGSGGNNNMPTTKQMPTQTVATAPVKPPVTVYTMDGTPVISHNPSETIYTTQGVTGESFADTVINFMKANPYIPLAVAALLVYLLFVKK